MKVEIAPGPPGKKEMTRAWKVDWLVYTLTLKLLFYDRKRLKKGAELGSAPTFIFPQLDVNYTYWDYQRGAWQKDHGIRIDHLLLSAPAMDLLIDVGIDKDPRGKERPSDHTPIWVELNN